jgi:NAD-dependent SIR2 family protein deacetylase
MDFICPKCAGRSFMVLHGEPMKVECLKCGKVAPFSVAVGPAEYSGEPPPLWKQKPTKRDK